MLSEDINNLTKIVARYLNIEDITHGGPDKQYLARYRGRLINEDSAYAYSQLTSQLKPYDITPIFRSESDQHAILLLPGVITPTASRVWINILLFVLTVISVLIAGVYYTLGAIYDGPFNPGFQDLLPYIRESLGGGVAFAVSILAILLAHEFGHYLAARYHRSAVTLPYFIPFPFSPFGTMGAFIQLKEPPKNKRILLDIGIAGPLAGLAVAIPVLLIGLSLSQTYSIPVILPPGEAIQMEGNSLLYLLMKSLSLASAA